MRLSVEAVEECIQQSMHFQRGGKDRQADLLKDFNPLGSGQEIHFLSLSPRPKSRYTLSNGLASDFVHSLAVAS
jgi:hypothetical protein